MNSTLKANTVQDQGNDAQMANSHQQQMVSREVSLKESQQKTLPNLEDNIDFDQ